MTIEEYKEIQKNDKIKIGEDLDPRGWAVQPASWFNFDPDGVVYCADINTAYRVAQDQTSVLFRDDKPKRIDVRNRES